MSSVLHIDATLMGCTYLGIARILVLHLLLVMFGHEISILLLCLPLCYVVSFLPEPLELYCWQCVQLSTDQSDESAVFNSFYSCSTFIGQFTFVLVTKIGLNSLSLGVLLWSIGWNILVLNGGIGPFCAPRRGWMVVRPIFTHPV